METQKKIPYPKSVFFIIVNEFCERFSYYGMKAVLTIYLVNILGYRDDPATMIYHIFSGFCYFTPLFGAMLADSILGKFRTILYLSVVYALGNIVLSLAATPTLGLPPRTISMLGLALIAIGTGGIKPCVSAFGGDQFVLPQQERHLSTFFSIFYFAINAGSLISTFITPIFRKDVSCFGQDTCYSLAFGVPAALMVTALVIFIVGKPWYRIRQTDGNIVMKVSRCIIHAISRKKAVVSTGDIREHFLDYADDKYDKNLIEDVKVLLRILILYIPLPFFWSLFDQQGSRWTLQATRMNGKLFGWLIKPDQMQVVNPFLILALIPIFDQIIYPALKKVNLLTKPLQRLTFGGILAGIAFIISGVLELNLEPTYAVKLGETESQVHFINSLPCSVNLTIDGELGTRSIDSFQISILSKIPATHYDGNIFVDTTNPKCKSFNPNNAPFKFIAEQEKAFSYIIEAVNGTITVNRDKNEDELEKSKEGRPKLKMLISGMIQEVGLNATLLLVNEIGEVSKALNLQKNASVIFEAEGGLYHFLLSIPANETINRVKKEMNVSGSIDPQLGGNYIFTLMKSASGELSVTSYTITEPNSIHMLWLLPQYTVITIGEVMFSVTGLEFSFSQAPSSLKSCIQAAWLLTVAFGNLIVVFITEFVKFDKQSKEFFLFAGLMFVDMIVFAILAYFYKPSTPRADIDEASSPDIPMDSHDNRTFEKD